MRLVEIRVHECSGDACRDMQNIVSHRFERFNLAYESLYIRRH